MSPDAALPEPIGTRYEYEPVLRDGCTLYLAGQIAKMSADRLHATGLCGAQVDLDTACRSAEIAAGQALAWAQTELAEGEALDRILRLTVYVAVAPGWSGISEVADAASRVFIARLGEAGRHVRSVVGVALLPRNAPVLLEVTARVR